MGMRRAFAPPDALADRMMKPSPADRPEPIMTPGEDLARAFDQEVSLIDYDMLRETFNQFDTDGSGAVDFNELEAMVTSMGMALTPLELYNMLSEADEDDTGGLTPTPSRNPGASSEAAIATTLMQ